MKLVKETIQWETQSPKRIAMKRILRKKKRSRLGGRILVSLGCILFILAAIKITLKQPIEIKAPLPIPQMEFDLQKAEFQGLKMIQNLDTTWVRLPEGKEMEASRVNFSL